MLTFPTRFFSGGKQAGVKISLRSVRCRSQIKFSALEMSLS